MRAAEMPVSAYGRYTVEQKVRHAQSRREYSRLLAQAGLCISCKARATRGLRCDDCAAKNAARATRWKRKRVEAGKCTQCGQEARPSRTTCRDCADNKHALKWLKKNGMPRGRKRSALLEAR
jgi:hypothetical protein